MDVGVGFPEPDWWNPRMLQDAREYELVGQAMNHPVYAMERSWISSGTGWVYVYVVGH